MGRKPHLDAIKRNPLLRAVRIDKFTVSALEVTLREYLDVSGAMHNIPVLRMLACPNDEVKKKAVRLYRILKKKLKVLK